jgi:hypothetical protein
MPPSVLHSSISRIQKLLAEFCRSVNVTLLAAALVPLHIKWFRMVFKCDAYNFIRDRHRPLFCHNGVPQLSSEFYPVDGSLAEFMHQDVLQLSAFIHYCFSTRA